MPTVDLDGTTFDSDDFEGFGYAATITYQAQQVPRHFAMWQAGIAEITSRLNNAAAGSILFAFSDATADADPGAGALRLNSASPASATQIFIDDASAAGTDVSATIAAWATGTSTIKGEITIRHVSDATAWEKLSLTGLTDAGGYTKLSVTHVDGGTTPLVDADPVAVSFQPRGDKGDTGSVSSAGSLTISADVPQITLTDTGDGSDGRIYADAGTITISADAGAEAANSQVIFRADNTIVSQMFAGGKLAAVGEIQAGGKFVWKLSPVGSTGSNQTLPVSGPAEVSATITADIAIATTASDANTGYSVLFIVTQGGAGGFTPAFTSGTWCTPTPDWASQAPGTKTGVLLLFSAAEGRKLYEVPLTAV